MRSSLKYISTRLAKVTKLCLFWKICLHHLVKINSTNIQSHHSTPAAATKRNEMRWSALNRTTFKLGLFPCLCRVDNKLSGIIPRTPPLPTERQHNIKPLSCECKPVRCGLNVESSFSRQSAASNSQFTPSPRQPNPDQPTTTTVERRWEHSS